MSQTDFKPEVQAMVDRLKAVDFSKFVYDKGQIKEALYIHLKELGLSEMPIFFTDEFRVGYNAARSAARSAAWSAAESAAWSAAWSAIESAARNAAWSAAWSAAESAARNAALLQYCKTDADFKYYHIWLPFLKAFEAGLWIYWITEKNIICIPRPVILMKGKLLHCESGPAVNWNDREKYYFLNGVNVGEKIVMIKELDPHILLKEKNAEIRREIVRKIGIERVCQKLGSKTLEKRWGYELITLNLGDGRNRPYLKMVNPSVRVYHLEGVAPEIKTVEEALNWRNETTKYEEPLILT